MAWKDRYNRPGPGIPKDAPKKKGFRLFFDILFREFFELVKLNLLFLLFCIPVVTIPAALTAMSRVTLKIIRDENHFLWADFWGTFKSELIPATLGGWAFLLMLGFSIFGAHFYSAVLAGSPLAVVPLAVSLIVGFVVLSGMFYFFPMRALVDLPLGQSMKNAVLLAFACLAPNLGAAAIFTVSVGLLTLFLVLAAPLILLIACALLNLICTFIAYGGLCKYVIAQDGEAGNV